MTFRDKIVTTLALQYDQYGFNRQDAADAILALVREHLTSTEFTDQLEWPIKAMYPDRWRQFINKVIDET